jgi:hypothetical protein
MRICTVATVGLLLLSVRGIAPQPVSAAAAERVVVPSGTGNGTRANRSPGGHPSGVLRTWQ